MLLAKDRSVESSFEKKSCPIENTRKMRKIDMPPLIAKIHHDTFVKNKNCEYYICRKLSQLEHMKIEKKIDRYLQRYNQFSKNMLTSKYAN